MNPSINSIRADLITNRQVAHLQYGGIAVANLVNVLLESNEGGGITLNGHLVQGAMYSTVSMTLTLYFMDGIGKSVTPIGRLSDTAQFHMDGKHYFLTFVKPTDVMDDAALLDLVRSMF